MKPKKGAFRRWIDTIPEQIWCEMSKLEKEVCLAIQQAIGRRLKRIRRG